MASGSIRIWGRVGRDEAPFIVSPLTVEPSKPRLCLEGSLLTKLDDKSGYDHVHIQSTCEQLTGFQWGGYWYVATTLPFGLKNSAFVYHTINMQATAYLRNMGISLLLYIDDRLIVGSGPSATITEDQKALIQSTTATYTVCQLLTKLGYTLNLDKCSLTPSTELRFLGMIVDTIRRAFILPEDKREDFKQIRQFILSRHEVSLVSIQRFVGKCVSFIPAVPLAKLYTAQANLAISYATRNGGTIPVQGPLREEVAHWTFLDLWQESLPWKTESHQLVTLWSDSSGYKWGGKVQLQDRSVIMGDYWKSEDLTLPIMIK